MLHNDDGDAMHLATGTLCDEDGACVCLECAEVLAPELCAERRKLLGEDAEDPA